MHGYFTRTLEKTRELIIAVVNDEQKNQKLTLHFEGCMSAIKEKEIPNKVFDE